MCMQWVMASVECRAALSFVLWCWVHYSVVFEGEGPCWHITWHMHMAQATL